MQGPDLGCVVMANPLMGVAGEGWAKRRAGAAKADV
jgi:hypothetical protein